MHDQCDHKLSEISNFASQSDLIPMFATSLHHTSVFQMVFRSSKLLVVP